VGNRSALMPSYRSGMRALTALVCVALLSPAAADVAVARSRDHTVSVTVPAPLDYTLATLSLPRPVVGLRVSVSGPTPRLYVASAALRTRVPPPAVQPRQLKRQQLFVLIVNRDRTAATPRQPVRLRVHIHTRTKTVAPAFSEHVNILANGAPGQNCAALNNYPALGHPYMWGYELRALSGPGTGFGIAQTIALVARSGLRGRDRPAVHALGPPAASPSATSVDPGA
jgi:hypothetical protein